jgi:hypothetical protein
METFFVGLLAILVGAGFCFMGYRLFLILMPIWGFFAGFAVGAAGISALFGTGFLSTVLGWVVGLVLGVIFALLAYFIYWAAIVILATSAAYSLGAGIITGFGWPGFIAFIVGVAFAVAAVLLAIFLDVPQILVFILTALAGAGALLAGVLLWIGHIKVEDLHQGAVAAVILDSWFWFVLYLALAIAGIFVQIVSVQGYQLERTAYQY